MQDCHACVLFWVISRIWHPGEARDTVAPRTTLPNAGFSWGQPLSLISADGFKLGAYRADPAGKPRGAWWSSYGGGIARFADAPPVLYYIRTTGGKFETAGQQVETAPEGIATRKGDPLGKKIAAAVLALYHSGQMKTILAKWQASQFALKNQ